MNPLTVKNTTHDEANRVTYTVMATRILSDGELFHAIRAAILKSGRRPQRGETLIINEHGLHYSE